LLRQTVFFYPEIQKIFPLTGTIYWRLSMLNKMRYAALFFSFLLLVSFNVGCDNSEDSPVQPDVTVTPGSFDFFNTDVSAANAKIFTVTNNTAVEVTINAISITGTDADQYSVTNSDCVDSTIAADAAETFEITFSPDAEGVTYAAVKLKITAETEKTFSVDIMGCAGANVVDFEELTLADETFWNGSDKSGSFNSGDATFTNTFTSSDWGDSWDGYAYSNRTDITAEGMPGQYTACTEAKGGVKGSGNYGIYYPHYNTATSKNESVMLIFGVASGDYSQEIAGMYVTNNSYDYWSMMKGDTYAKKFGGETGGDPDWFKLTIYAVDPETYERNPDKKVEFYLADFRFKDNSKDYIVKDWTWVDLSSLGEVFGLEFEFDSSDKTGDYLNTPSYFVMDNITLFPGAE